MSSDLVVWETAVENAFLLSVYHKQCAVPFQVFDSNPVSGRFVKFTVVSFYGLGGGLNFISWGGKYCFSWHHMFA